MCILGCGRSEKSDWKGFWDKRANFVGIKSTLLKLWHSRGLCEVVNLGPNLCQFVFTHKQDRESVMQRRR